jgi:hypothetical protein
VGNYTKVSGVATGDVVKIDGIANASIVKINGATRAAAADTEYDWADTEIFNQTTITAGSSDSPGGGNGYWNAYGGYQRKTTSLGGEYDNTIVPYFSSSATNALCLADVGHMDDNSDDFYVIISGSQDPAGNHGLVCHTATGVEFDGGNMVSGDHVIMWKFKHDAKSDTWHTMTSVLNCSASSSGSILSGYRALKTGPNSLASYYTVEEAKVDAFLHWQLIWTKATNTWSVADESDKMYDSSGTGHPVSYQTTGSFIGKHIGDNQIRNADPADHWVWKIDVEEV